MPFESERLSPFTVLSWQLGEIATALGISPGEVTEYFTDGRRVSFVVERRLCALLGWELPSSEGADHDLRSPAGNLWEVRSITAQGTYFCPSYMVGSGRTFDEAGFLRKLAQIRGYLLADVRYFPEVPVFVVLASEALRL